MCVCVCYYLREFQLSIRFWIVITYRSTNNKCSLIFSKKLSRDQIYNSHIFTIYCLNSFRVARNNRVHVRGILSVAYSLYDEIMLALLSILRGKLFLSRFVSSWYRQADICLGDDKCAFVHYFIGVKCVLKRLGSLDCYSLHCVGFFLQLRSTFHTSMWELGNKQSMSLDRPQ